MSYYDYIELQPLDCYKNLLDRGSITDVEDLNGIYNLFMIPQKKQVRWLSHQVMHIM